MRRKVVFVEITVSPAIAPLASGYLEAVAKQNAELDRNFEFEKFAWCVDQPDLMNTILKIEGDVFAFSCYVWNMGLIKKVVEQLKKRSVDIILGGPQVIDQAEKYISSADARIVICNGEGEHTFSDYLLQLLRNEPDFSLVKGLSYVRNGEIFTTEKRDRIRDLDQVPSPYLNGLIDPSKFNFAVLESNRGCPFRCTYCYWGAATNAKVNKFSEDRIFDEITWLCEQGFVFILFADANFGILKRDIEIARHVAECKKATGFPHSVLISSSKNTPERVTAVTKILGDAGLIVSQPVSMQSMSDETLKAVERDNISIDGYKQLQQQLISSGLQSFIEIIWPLPGETLQSFKNGLDDLCRMRADSFVIYPLMLINNVKMSSQRDEFGLITMIDPDPNSEAEIVIGTNAVPNEQYLQGLILSYNLTCLYSFKGLRLLMEHLDRTGKMTFTEVCTSFWDFAKSFPESQYVQYVNSIVTSMEVQSGVGTFAALGGAIHSALHAEPRVFDDLLAGLVKKHGLLADPIARLHFEIDLLNRPLIYSNSPVADKSDRLEMIKIEAVDADTITIGITDSMRDSLVEILTREQLIGNSTMDEALFNINYRTPEQIPFIPKFNIDSYYHHCQYKNRSGTKPIEPTWSRCDELLLKSSSTRN